MNRRSGYTLMEILVASGIFVFLGVALVAFMRQGMSIWRIAQTRGTIYERARALLGTVSDDLRSMATDVSDDGHGFWVRLICDRDPNGRQRLRFVRSLAGETSDPIARYGGEFLALDDAAYYDHSDDLLEIEQGRLLPPAGYQEVLYAFDPDPAEDVIWRGVRAPVGGAETLFADRNLEEKDEKSGRRTSRRVTATPPSDDEKPQVHPLKRHARPFLDDVLYLGFRFWGPTTNTWSEANPMASQPTTKPSGPLDHWDSTRAILKGDGPLFRGDASSLTYPHDDIFPERVQVTVVLAGSADTPNLELTGDISPQDTFVPLLSTGGLPTEGPFRFVRVESEWIEYESVEANGVKVARGGRGARGTRAAKHLAGEPVEIGTTFRRVVEIPTFHTPSAARNAEDTRSGRGRSRR